MVLLLVMAAHELLSWKTSSEAHVVAVPSAPFQHLLCPWSLQED